MADYELELQPQCDGDRVCRLSSLALPLIYYSLLSCNTSAVGSDGSLNVVWTDGQPFVSTTPGRYLFTSSTDVGDH